MPEPVFEDPEFEDVLDEDVAMAGQNVPSLVNWVAAERASAERWRGRCEVLEWVVTNQLATFDAAIEQMVKGHALVIKQMAVENELTIGYLKDRLNRLEVPRDGAAS